MRAEEAKEREAAYAKLAVEFGQDVVDALKEHFSIIYYPSDFYVFLEEVSKNEHKDKNIVSKL